MSDEPKKTASVPIINFRVAQIASMKIRFGQTIFLFLIGGFFSFLYWYGVYGVGVDFVGTYSQSNLAWGSWYKDGLGYRMVTLTVKNVHLGIFVTAGATIFGVIYFLWKTMQPRRGSEFLLLFLTLILLLHSWPVLMGILNGMRQAVYMGVFYVAYVNINREEVQKKLKILILFLLLLSTAIHNVALSFFFVTCVALFASHLSKYYFRGSVALLGLIFGVAAISFLGSGLYPDQASRVIANDFRAPFFVINISLIVAFIVLRGNDPRYLFAACFNAAFIPVLLLGFNWEYERVNMIFLYINIVYSALLFKRKHQFPVLFITAMILFFATIFTGMYDALDPM